MFFVGVFSHIIPIIVLGLVSLSLFFNGIENKAIDNLLSFTGIQSYENINVDVDHSQNYSNNTTTDNYRNILTDLPLFAPREKEITPAFIEEIHFDVCLQSFGSRAPPQFS